MLGGERKGDTRKGDTPKIKRVPIGEERRSVASGKGACKEMGGARGGY